MKARIGVDADSGLVHTVVSTAANISDISQTAARLKAFSWRFTRARAS